MNEQEAKFFLGQIRLLESESYQKAIESCISLEKVNAAYAIMTNRDELTETFRNLEEPVVRAHPGYSGNFCAADPYSGRLLHPDQPG